MDGRLTYGLTGSISMAERRRAWELSPGIPSEDVSSVDSEDLVNLLLLVLELVVEVMS